MRDADLLFEWKVHPLRQSPQRAILFLCAMSFLLIAVWWSFQSLGWALLATVLVGGSLHRFWLVTTYRISTEEVEYQRLFFRLSRRLSDFKRIVLEPAGVFLSPFPEPHRLDPYRGLFLPYPPAAGPFVAFLKRQFADAETNG